MWLELFESSQDMRTLHLCNQEASTKGDSVQQLPKWLTVFIRSFFNSGASKQAVMSFQDHPRMSKTPGKNTGSGSVRMLHAD